MGTPEPPSLREDAEPAVRFYARAAKRQALLVLGTVLAAVLVATGVVASQDRIYEASKSFVVGQVGGEVAPVIGSPAVGQTMVSLMRSDVVASSVVRKLRLDISTGDLKKKLDVAAAPVSGVIEVRIRWNDKARAKRILDEFSSVFADQLERTLGVRLEGGPLARRTAHPVIFAATLDPSHVSPDAVSPKPASTLAIAAALGLVVGLILAVVRERLDDSIRSRRDALQSFGAPIVGLLPKGWLRSARRAGPGGRLLSARHRGPARTARYEEALHLLGMNLELLAKHAPVTLVITSPHARAGKTPLVSGLATALALEGRDVVCVQVDTRQPSLRPYLGVEILDGEPAGVVQVALDEVDVERALVSVPIEGQASSTGNGRPAGDGGGRLRLLGTGVPQSRLRSLTDGQIESLVQRLHGTADTVIVDAPPLPATETSRLVRVPSSLVLVVARSGHTTRRAAATVRDTLHGWGVQRVGVVLVDAGAEDD